MRGRLSNRKYLDWLKTGECVSCGMPADDAHHLLLPYDGIMGSKQDDFMAVPVCRGCHDRIHRYPAAFYEVQQRWLRDTLRKAISEGVVKWNIPNK